MLRPVLTSVLADHRLTEQEWDDSLSPALEHAAPVGPSPAADVALALWNGDSVTLETAVKPKLSGFLRERGYPATLESPQTTSALKAANILEPDRDFEAVSQAAGRSEGTTLVAVIDTGIDLSHPALAGKLWSNPGEVAGNGADDDGDGRVDDATGWDFVDQDPSPAGLWHGTHVAGLTAAGTDRIRVMGLRAMGQGVSDPTPVVDAIHYAAGHGARIINLSLAASAEKSVSAALAAIEAHPEVLFILSAGNTREQLGVNPARSLPSHRLPNLLVVSASDKDGAPAVSFRNPKLGSAFGAPFATLAAPGRDVFSSVPDDYNPDGFAQSDGTSMATASVSAVAAKCLALAPHLTPPALKALLGAAVVPDPAWTGKTEFPGVLNEAAALRLAAGSAQDATDANVS